MYVVNKVTNELLSFSRHTNTKLRTEVIPLGQNFSRILRFSSNIRNR